MYGCMEFLWILQDFVPGQGGSPKRKSCIFLNASKNGVKKKQSVRPPVNLFIRWVDTEDIKENRGKSSCQSLAKGNMRSAVPLPQQRTNSCRMRRNSEFLGSGPDRG